ncbi:uncharacterized protein LOC128198019 isoform X2 [Bicyclus anynana]|uniref:Uncharacterized protein LOC128198019 isoform X2 n=1 Tax=Bicyclus anynana TaxID=110368 RepID=A0ABM3LMK9_BICAN|nr:uncharacterized protein LOC128198019 isoform X2 [Bicyclus anynana]
MPRRCEFGCPSPYESGVTIHRFPHMRKNPELFKVWVHAVGGKLEKQEDYEYYQRKVICDRHFKEQDKNRNNRLNSMAVPSLHLPDDINQPGALAVTPDVPSASLLLEQVTSSSSINQHHMEDDINLPGALAVTPDVPSASLLLEQVTPSSSIKQHQLKGKRVCKKVTSSVITSQLGVSRTQIKLLKNEIKILQNRCNRFKARLAGAEKIGRNNFFRILTQNMTGAAKIFTGMQYKQTPKKPNGRRFTLKEKVLSLSIYKRSPKNYNLLSKFFTLPSPRTLKSLLTQLKLEEGLNKTVFLKIKETVKELSPEDRLVTLMFDEMAIMPHIEYNVSKDKLQGFAFNSKTFADHVLVFMVKGIKKKFKQPVAYYFTSCLNKYKLEELIKKVIKYVQGTGLNIIATVCDQNTINVGAINALINNTKEKYIRENKEWRDDFIQIGNNKIFPLYDIPHIIKGIRNNILTKDLKYFDVDRKEEKIIKWDYYKQVYEADKSYGELKLLQKLTDEHIYREKIKKMKVKTAAQIFSHSVAVVTEHLTARGDVPQECRNIIPFTKMIDNLFDSLNSSTFHVPNGKIYRGCVKRNSPHHKLWNDAIKMLKSVKFIKVVKCNNSNKIRFVETSNVPSIQNLIKTIEGIKNVWNLLSHKYSFDAMFTRNFNQDPLENFFGNVRSLGIRNTAPDTVAFEGAYKSLLLNNFNTIHSSHANCEGDENTCLQNIDFFLKENVASVSEQTVSVLPDENIDNDEIVLPVINLNEDIVDAGQGNYVCGWVLTKCLTKVAKSCKDCRADVIGDPNHKSNEYLRAKEYNKNKTNLCYPSPNLSKCFVQIQNITHEMLKSRVPKTNLKKKIKIFTDIFVEYPFACVNHKNEMKFFFENTVINILIHSWCRSINRILTGKSTYNGDDEVKSAAQAYRNKHKCHKF